MNELLWVMVGVVALLILSLVLSALWKVFMSTGNQIDDKYIGKLENTELSIQDAMKELKLRNSNI